MNDAQQIAELARRLSNLIRLGTIAQVTTSPPRARVQIGPLLTAPLPWLTDRAGTTREWYAPTVGEQVIVFSPSGDLAGGVILPGLFTTAHPANGTVATLHRWTYPDGAVIEYDHAAHRLKASGMTHAEITATTEAKVTAPKVKVIGDIEVTGDITVSGDVVASGISLVEHTHPESVGSVTGPPQ